MAASDPTMAVATPTGVLQGVAAFSWDSTAWQPVGRAGPVVATPTGALQGVAPFAWDGSVWQPSGRAGPGVATPTGVLDGVAVYTWSGSAWTPAGGTATPSTPSGALRGVAAFSWDGSAWQPAAQAGPSVPTPYGVLDGVAMFNWTGSAWSPGSALPAGATLDLSFMTPGTLPPGVTFTRASTGRYFDSTGTMQTATANTPRWDYDPVTHALKGMLIEEARTNILTNSQVFNSWPTKTDVTIADNNSASPDGTTTAALVTEGSAGTASLRSNAGTITAGATVAHTVFVKRGSTTWLRLVVLDGALANGAQQWVNVLSGALGSSAIIGAGVSIVASMLTVLPNGWSRASMTVAMPAAATTASLTIATATADASSTRVANGTYNCWGAQLEVGALATSYIPTTAAAATRAAESANLTPLGAWFNASAGGFVYEFDMVNSNGVQGGFSGGAFANVIYFTNAGNGVSSIVASVGQSASGTIISTTGILQKMGCSYSTGRLAACNNGLTVGVNAALSASPYPWTTNMAFGSAPWSIVDNQIDGHMRRVRYWPRALSNAELQQVTT